jgi:hypothetical protein
METSKISLSVIVVLQQDKCTKNVLDIKIGTAHTNCLLFILRRQVARSHTIHLQDSLVGKALDSQADRIKVLGSILASTTKGAQHERLIVSPCEIIKICWSNRHCTLKLFLFHTPSQSLFAHNSSSEFIIINNLVQIYSTQSASLYICMHLSDNAFF